MVTNMVWQDSLNSGFSKLDQGEADGIAILPKLNTSLLHPLLNCCIPTLSFH